MSRLIIARLRLALPALAGVLAPVPRPSANAVGVAAALQAEMEAVVHDTAARWNSRDYSTVMDCRDRDKPNVMYLAEEQPGWFVGWPRLKVYLGSNTPFLEAIREEMSNLMETGRKHRAARFAP